jgi:hypothetical protein
MRSWTSVSGLRLRILTRAQMRTRASSALYPWTVPVPTASLSSAPHPLRPAQPSPHHSAVQTLLYYVFDCYSGILRVSVVKCSDSSPAMVELYVQIWHPDPLRGHLCLIPPVLDACPPTSRIGHALAYDAV